MSKWIRTKCEETVVQNRKSSPGKLSRKASLLDTPDVMGVDVEVLRVHVEVMSVDAAVTGTDAEVMSIDVVLTGLDVDAEIAAVFGTAAVRMFATANS